MGWGRMHACKHAGHAPCRGTRQAAGHTPRGCRTRRHATAWLHRGGRVRGAGQGQCRRVHEHGMTKKGSRGQPIPGHLGGQCLTHNTPFPPQNTPSRASRQHSPHARPQPAPAATTSTPTATHPGPGPPGTGASRSPCPAGPAESSQASRRRAHSCGAPGMAGSVHVVGARSSMRACMQAKVHGCALAYAVPWWVQHGCACAMRL